jgi:hypothetical protein
MNILIRRIKLKNYAVLNQRLVAKQVIIIFFITTYVKIKALCV